MDQKSDSNEKTTTPDKDPLPVGKTPPAVPSVDSLGPLPPRPIGQQNITPPPPDNPRSDDETDRSEPMPIRVVNDPLRTRVVGDDELGVFERSTLRYAKLGVFVGVVTLLVIIGTAVVFWDQFKEMASQTNLLAIAARQARTDAKDARVITAKQLDIAKDTMRIDQRAWIGVRIQGQRIVNQPYVPKAYFKNTGKTTAKHVKAYAFAEPVDKGKNPNFNWKIPPVNLTVIMPGSETFAEMHPIKGDILNDTIDKLFEPGGGKIMYVHGRISYCDVFRVPHWMTFCYSLDESGTTASICAPNGRNEIDGEEKENPRECPN